MEKKAKGFFDSVKDCNKSREQYMVNLKKERKDKMFMAKTTQKQTNMEQPQCLEPRTTEIGKDHEQEASNSASSKLSIPPSIKYENVLKVLVPSIYDQDADVVSCQNIFVFCGFYYFCHFKSLICDS